MKVLLTGATGLLGGEILDLLLSAGHEPRCLVRPQSPRASRLDPSRAEVAYGDAGDAGSLRRALSGTDTLLHVAGIEYAAPVVEAARGAGVPRLVVVGSTSAHSAYEFRSGPKRSMEDVVRASGLDWTIARPTMIYGSERDKNVHRLLRFLDRSPVFPMFGPGTNLWQPVYHRDCARGIVETLDRPETVRRAYDLPGAEPLSYKEMVRTAAQTLGKKTRIVYLPLKSVEKVLSAAEGLRLPLPIKSEQVIRLREDKAYPYDDARRDLDYEPRTFREGVNLEAARLREVGLIRTKPSQCYTDAV